MSAGWYYSLVLGDDGRPYGTGLNEDGQLTGKDTTKHALSRLVGLPAGVHATQVAASAFYSYVVGDDGRVYRTSKRLRKLVPLRGLPVGVRATSVSAGIYHAVALGDDGIAYGVGTNFSGQLTGTTVRSQTLTPMTGLPGGVRVTAVAAGTNFSLVLGSDGRAYGTGTNHFGQLTGSVEEKRTLTAMTGLPSGVRATGIAAGGHSLVLGDDGTVYGAGNNASGQLTGTTRGEKHTLTALTGLPTGVLATAVAAGNGHSLALGDDGLVYGTGFNRQWQLTGPRNAAKRTLTELTGLPANVRALQISGGGVDSLVLGNDGIVYGAGSNRDGQLTGIGSRRTLTPLVWAFVNLTAPRITGRPHVGATLTARHGEWSPTPTSYTYIWFRSGNPIPGATSRTHLLVARDIGTKIRVRVTAVHPGYRSAALTTSPTARISR